MRAIPLLVLVCCVVAGPVTAGARQVQGSPVYEPGNGVSAPVVVKEAKPRYTADAMRAKVEGTVTLEGIVQPDGVIDEVRVTKALDPDLDQEAIKAFKEWRFKPGLKDGKPVPVRVTIAMSFTLRDRRAKPPVQLGSASSLGAGGATLPAATHVYEPGNGVSAPVVVQQAKPRYTPAAREAGITGIVVLECVVETTGSVGAVKVTRSLDEGLDREAINAVRQWRFEPGMKDGKAVPVRIKLEMTFSLK